MVGDEGCDNMQRHQEYLVMLICIPGQFRMQISEIVLEKFWPPRRLIWPPCWSTDHDRWVLLRGLLKARNKLASTFEMHHDSVDVVFLDLRWMLAHSGTQTIRWLPNDPETSCESPTAAANCQWNGATKLDKIGNLKTKQKTTMLNSCWNSNSSNPPDSRIPYGEMISFTYDNDFFLIRLLRQRRRRIFIYFLKLLFECAYGE